MSKSLTVMVVDDTSIYRMIMRKVAESIPGIRVTDFAANGRIALEKLSRRLVDVVLLDVEMPEMDGLTTLRHITEKYPTVSVVMVSALSRSNANIVVECLNSGALDFVTKPLESNVELSKKALSEELNPILSVIDKDEQKNPTAVTPTAKPAPTSPAPTRPPATRSPRGRPPIPAAPTPRPAIGGLSNRGTTRSPATTPAPAPTAPTAKEKTARDNKRPNAHPRASWKMKPALLLIGSSTGGPAALTRVLNNIDPGLPVPAIIVQHMPPLFTTSLAAQLSRSTGHQVTEVKEGQEFKPGHFFLAPGGKHLSVKKQGKFLRASLNDGPKVNGCRPAVDVLFMSVMATFTEPILSVILTGMGRDGANGVKGLKRLGKTFCITQNKASCVVYGMPRATEEMGLSDLSVPLDQIGGTISALCK